MAAQRLVIFGDWLVQDVLKVWTDVYLDLERGIVAYKEDLKGHKAGEGRPGARRSRFVKVPSMLEATVEIAARLSGLRKLPRCKRHFDERVARAASIATQKWLTSLRLPHEIVWTEGYGKQKKTLVYRRSTGRWQPTTQPLLRLLNTLPQGDPRGSDTLRSRKSCTLRSHNVFPQRLFIDGIWLAQEILRAKPLHHLDLFQGEMVSRSSGRGRTVGEGRPAVTWARYLRIPCLWEAVYEAASRFPGPQTIPNPRRRPYDPRYIQAALIVARNWLVSLRLPHEIVWWEKVDETEKILIYRPGVGKWQRSRQRLHKVLERDPNPGTAS